MKRFVRFVCLIMAMACLLSVPVFAAQEQQAGTYASSYFTMLDQYLWKVSNTQVQVWFEVVSPRGMDQLGVSLVKVQRSTDQTNWETVQTYTPEDYPQMLCPNTSAHSECVTYNYTSGYYYRAFVMFYATRNGGIGKYSAYTAVMRL